MLRYASSFGLTILLLTLVACSHSGTTTAPPEETPEPVTAAPYPMEIPTGKTTDPNAFVAPMNQFQPQPPDGKWLVDEFGREYYIVEIPRVDGTYFMESPTRVRIQNGFSFDITGFDEETFFGKVYRPGDPTAPVTALEPTQDEIDQVEATYRPDTATSNRLRFEPVESGLPTSGQWRNGFALADMNGDGNLDLVHGPPRRSMSRTPVIYLGDGKGRFERWIDVSLPPAPYDYGDVAAGDFDGDGHLDLAFATHLTGLIAVRGDGSGRFVPMQTGLPLVEPGAQSPEATFTSRTIMAVDWTGDGRADLLALSEGPARAGRDASSYVGGKRVFTYEDGAWRTIEPTREIDRVFGDDLATGDFNGDGRIDFANSASQLGNRNVLNFGETEGAWRQAPLEGIRERGAVSAVEAGDLNGDGIDDLAVALITAEPGGWRTVIDLFTSLPGGTWDRRTLWSEPGRDAVAAMALGDLDGDGATDLVAVDRAGRVLSFPGDGRGNFTRDQALAMSEEGDECRGYDVELADVDGDGRAEIVASFAGDGCRGGGSFRVLDVSSVTRPDQ